MQKKSVLVLALAGPLWACAGARVQPTFATFQSRHVAGYEVLGSQGNVLPTAGKGQYPAVEENKYELNLGFRLQPDAEPTAFFLVTYRGDGWAYLQEGASALSILADGTIYRFTGMDADYRKIRGRHVFESATYPVRGRELRSIAVAREAVVRIACKNSTIEVPLSPENQEHLRRFLAYEVDPRVQEANASR